jgi:hypothetical protein
MTSCFWFFFDGVVSCHAEKRPKDPLALQIDSHPEPGRKRTLHLFYFVLRMVCVLVVSRGVSLLLMCFVACIGFVFVVMPCLWCLHNPENEYL